MPAPDAVRQVLDLGGMVLFVLTVTLIGWGAIKEHPWWVPGWVHRREIESGDRSATQAERTADALEKLVRILDVGELDDRRR